MERRMDDEHAGNQQTDEQQEAPRCDAVADGAPFRHGAAGYRVIVARPVKG
jgi:hypothetical protein